MTALKKLDFYQADLLTITPNTRLSETIIGKASDALMKSRGVNAVQAPNVCSLADYIADAWSELQSANYSEACKHALVSDSVLFYQWVSVIRKDNELETILNPTELASQAHSASKRLALWKIADYSADSPETEIFKRWQQEVERTTSGFVSSEQALAIIIDAIENDVLPVPKIVCAFSFDDLPPLHEQFFETIGQKAKLIQSDFSRHGEATPYSVCNFDDDEQLSNMARWAFNAHQQDPGAQLAIVVPDLPNKREAVLNALNDVFEPQVILPQTKQYTPPYNITAGTPLSSQPMIKLGLDVLRYGFNEVPLEGISKVIKSPFIAHSVTERSRRAKFDLQLRKNGKTVHSLLDLTGSPECPRKLSMAIGKFANAINNRSETTSLAQWLTLFDESLKAIGWPGERNLNSEEFQALKQFKDLLLELSGNFTFNADLTIDSALFYLVTACNNTLYSAESKETPIQVMGLLEAAGLSFDKMYLLDMNMGTVPAKAAPNTFLPVQLQVDHKMPHADAERELSFFESILSRYNANCDEIIYSYCQYQHESDLTPSYFVSGDSVPAALFKAPTVDYKAYLINRIPVQTVYDEPVRLDTTKKAKGGVSVLQNQTLCPFKNFVANRLRVREFPKVRDGLSAPVRGQLLHDIMARIWKKLRTQTELLALTEEQQHQLVASRTNSAFVALRGRTDLDDSLVMMEKTHLQNIIGQWLDFERTRPPFMVEAIEEDRQIRLGHFDSNDEENSETINVSIRLDRVDAVQNEEKKFTSIVPIDYKSGTLSLRVSAPAFRDVQLPLAALSKRDNLAGMAYAGIKKHNIKMLGLSDGTEIGKGVNSTSSSKANIPGNFDAALQHWSNQLNKIAQDFIAGEAHITPSPDACRYCANQVICRSA